MTWWQDIFAGKPENKLHPVIDNEIEGDPVWTCSFKEAMTMAYDLAISGGYSRVTVVDPSGTLAFDTDNYKCVCKRA